MFFIIFYLVLTLLFPVVVVLDFTLELGSFVFALLVFFLILMQFGLLALKNNDLPRKQKVQFCSFDITYAMCVGLTIFSFLFISQNVKTFHYVFVVVGMYYVFLLIRTEEFNNLTTNIFKKKLLIHFIILIAFINAIIGIYQFVTGKEIIGTFGYSSFFGCFLAMNVPIAFGFGFAIWENLKSSNRSPLKRDKYSVIGNRFLAAFSLFAFIVILAATALTRSRTAMIGLGVVLSLMLVKWKSAKVRKCKNPNQHSPKSPFKKVLFARIWKCGLLLVALVSVVYCGKILYKLKPMSAVGRTLIWKVSTDMFFKNPVSGVGFGNLANQYNLYQADFFASGKGSVVNKMTAGQVRHTYNWYLETAVEFGIFGLIVFGIFWWLVLVEVYKAFKPYKEYKDIEEKQTENRMLKTEYFLNLGMAGSVLCFMIMCLFQFPNKIIPTFLVFNVALAWIVNANLEENSKTQIINNQ